MGPMPMRFGPGGHGGPFLMVHRKLVVRSGAEVEARGSDDRWKKSRQFQQP